MSTNLDKYKQELSKLIDLGEKILIDLGARTMEETSKQDDKIKEFIKKFDGRLEKDYQKWYTEANTVIRQIIPERLYEFDALYKGEGKRKEFNAMNFTIQDWLNGVRSSSNYLGEKRFNDFAIIAMKYKTQFEILKSAELRFESSLFDIKQVVQADLFDSELDSAKELLKNGFLRGAGAISGVVLEKHLSEVCDNHRVVIRKKNPSISDFNDLLKNNKVIDIPDWRFIQRLGDLRNLCGHNKERNPTKEEVNELIHGVEKVSKTIY